MAMKQFRDNDTSDGSQSHREMMVQVQCGQDSRLSPVRIFNKERVITYRWEKIIKIQYAVIYVEATFKVELDKSVGI